MNTYFFRTLSAIAITAACMHPALAAPIPTGSQISTGGVLSAIGVTDGTVATATGLDFLAPTDTPPNIKFPNSPGILTGYVGNNALSSFNCSPDLACGFINDIDFNGFMSDAHFIDALGFSYRLNQPLTVTRVPGTENAAAALIVSGTGIMNFNGFDPTAGLFTLVTLNNAAGATTFSATLFSTGEASSVPEPTSIMLMGLGVAGLLAARRKSKV